MIFVTYLWHSVPIKMNKSLTLLLLSGVPSLLVEKLNLYANTIDRTLVLYGESLALRDLHYLLGIHLVDIIK